MNILRFVKRSLCGRELKGDFKRRAVIGTVPIALSLFVRGFKMFLAPVRISSRTYNYSKNNSNAEQKDSKTIHKFYSSLLKKNTPINSIKNRIKPIINDAAEIVSGAASFATTMLTKITWAKFKHNLAKAPFCFLFSFIKDILQQIMRFVNERMRIKFRPESLGTYGVRGVTVPRPALSLDGGFLNEVR